MPISRRVVAAAALIVVAGVVGVAIVTAPSSSSTASEAPTPPPASSSGPAANTTAPADQASAPTAASTIPAPTTAVPPVPTPDLPDRGVHPELRDIDGWLQSDVTSLEELRGQVVAVQFWTFGCRNCKATLEHMQDLYATYRDQGFEIVGVHAPEFAYEAEVDNIVAAAADLGVTWPIVLDTDKRTFHLWQEGPRAFWPRIYLLDRNGHIRYDHTGEGRYDEIEAAVQALLAEPT